MDPWRLYAEAEAARTGAYALDSRFCVGVATQWRDGYISAGVNVENGSFGLTIYAERVAAARAVAGAHRVLKALVIAGDAGTLSPRGACRQFVAELDRAGRNAIKQRIDRSIS